MILRTIVADDEELARDEIIYLLSDHPDIEVVGQAANGPDVLESVRRLAPDLLFLDIQMPGLDGFEVVEALSSSPKPPAVIFVTAYDAYAVNAFKVNAIDYILKPVDRDRIGEAVGRAAARIRSGQTEALLSSTAALLSRMERPGSRPGRVSIRHGGRYLIVDSEAIRYATMRDGQVDVVADKLEGATSFRSLDELEAALQAPSFFRTHRSYLVNLNHVVEVIPWFSGRLRLRVDDGRRSEIPVSRERAKLLKKVLKI